MKRWIPHPLLALVLTAMWLLSNQSLAPGHFRLGAAIALVACRGLAALRPEPVRMVSLRPIARLAGIVLADIVRSNLAVESIFLFKSKRL